MNEQTYKEFVNSLFKEFPTEIETMLHAGIGISGEAGEILDALKKTWVYNKPLDRDNLIEELGDLLFYAQKLADIMGLELWQVMLLNRKKLQKRYPTGAYTDLHAQERLDKK